MEALEWWMMRSSMCKSKLTHWGRACCTGYTRVRGEVKRNAGKLQDGKQEESRLRAIVVVVRIWRSATNLGETTSACAWYIFSRCTVRTLAQKSNATCLTSLRFRISLNNKTALADYDYKQCIASNGWFSNNYHHGSHWFIQYGDEKGAIYCWECNLGIIYSRLRPLLTTELLESQWRYRIQRFHTSKTIYSSTDPQHSRFIQAASSPTVRGHGKLVPNASTPQLEPRSRYWKCGCGTKRKDLVWYF